jgi:hypothetical protein
MWNSENPENNARRLAASISANLLLSERNRLQDRFLLLERCFH